IRMMSPGTVFDLVLDKLEARQSDCVEAEVVGAAGVGQRQGIRTQIHVLVRIEIGIPEFGIAKRIEPFAKDRTNVLVALHVYAADLAGTIVDVEVCRKLIILGQFGKRQRRCIRTASAAECRCRAVAKIAEMLFYVSARTEQTLLFTRPERNADCATRL